MPNHEALTSWILTETVFGEVIHQIGKAYVATGDERLYRLRGWTIPEGHVDGEESFGPQDPNRRGFEGAMDTMRYLRGEGGRGEGGPDERGRW